MLLKFLKVSLSQITVAYPETDTCTRVACPQLRRAVDYRHPVLGRVSPRWRVMGEVTLVKEMRPLFVFPVILEVRAVGVVNCGIFLHFLRP